MIDGDEGVDVRGDIQSTKGHRSGSVLVMARANNVKNNTSVLGKGVDVNLAGGAPIKPTGMT